MKIIFKEEYVGVDILLVENTIVLNSFVFLDDIVIWGVITPLF